MSTKKHTPKYDRVMPRVGSKVRVNPKPNFSVTRHENTSARVGGKQSVSNVSCSVFSELPFVLDDFIPEDKPPRQTFVVKPKRTLKSLEPVKPPVSAVKLREVRERSRNIRVPASAPSLLDDRAVGWSDSHVRQCYSSRSHSKLQELKSEIKAYKEKEELLKLQHRLYKRCGVLLDDTGRVAEHKAVQVERSESPPADIRTERGGVREDAGAAVSDQQMNPGTPRYPVDRYLVERSNNLEMVNIIDDGLWNAEPALRPEDEIILRKLHDMLQSTADDLKLLSGELSKYHEPGVQVKSLPTPLDEDFNEKVHIEEIVNAKFHGHKILDKSQPTPVNATQKVDKIDGIIKSIATNMQKPKKVVSTGIQVNNDTILKKPKRNNNLSISQTRIIQINENEQVNTNNDKKQQEKRFRPAVAYNEFSFKYVEPKMKECFHKPLQVQNMPSINIRSELKEQKVLQLNIEPNTIDGVENLASHNNVAVVSFQHEPVTVQNAVPINYNQVQFSSVSPVNTLKEPTRKVSKMSSCESSDSSNNMNIRYHTRHNTKYHRETKPIVTLPPKPRHENIKHKKNISSKRDSTKHSNLDEWKKKLNAVYGCPTSSRKAKTVKSANTVRKAEATTVSTTCNHPKKNGNTLNNAEYIPYSKLTLGGVRVSDIEKELSDIPNKNDIPLSPILDKILSRENSFHTESAHVELQEESPKILTTSDENLLREVLDIEEKVSNTLSKKVYEKNVSFEKNQHSNPIDDQDSYVDDFEDDKSNYSAQSGEKSLSGDAHSKEINSNSSDNDNESLNKDSEEKNIQNNTFTKTLNLSFKNKVDIFEFVHSVDTQETGTQSNGAQKISLKGTQTSPRNDRCNEQTIHNDLWPSIDPKGEVEKLFQLEKDFIKKLIVDEYGDLLDKTLNKPSTSRDIQTSNEKNVVASQKNTQTSPAHVKSVMTSPTRTKTRTTSPFVSLTVDKQTSPLVIEELKINVEDGDDLGISINLSSPRFSLRLPQTSHEVISNLESHTQSKRNHPTSNTRGSRVFRKNTVSSSSSVDGDYSSSDISSLGEVRFKLKRRLQKLKVPSISELSSSTSHSNHYSDSSDVIIPCRSQGEVSLGQVDRRKSNKHNKSEGEVSLGLR
ncbi:uncharacterized protein [Epargyreus clarus]|uniref:uncharacterized protein isoform X2 n=1 Tax=Epargyreus clarus TaxID=520877 RepID=UPI003C2D49BE